WGWHQWHLRQGGRQLVGPVSRAGRPTMEVRPHDEERVKEPMADPNVARVLAYHQLSKHHPHHYAPSPGPLDWANQPDPSRTFAGAPRVELPLLADALSRPFADLHNLPGIHPR